jgi:hypothetical protein
MVLITADRPSATPGPRARETRRLRGVTFDSAIAWLDEHLGRHVSATLRGPPESRGNSGAVLSGDLRRGSHGWGTIDSRGGELHGYDVGENAGFFLLEGDFVSAEVDDDVLYLVFRELQLNVTPT